MFTRLIHAGLMHLDDGSERLGSKVDLNALADRLKRDRANLRR